MKKPIILMILDGYGLNDRLKGNAIKEANTPVIDELMEKYPFVKGKASGLAVGLPEGQMGNSEVGHLNMGAGRIVYQDLTRITKSILDGDFYKNEALLEAINNCKKNGSDLHLMGLVSDGGVHSTNGHIYGILELARRESFDRVYIHAFMDGRDTSPTSGSGFIQELIDEMQKTGVGQIASVTGRYFAMDRDNRWERVVQAYDLLVKGQGNVEESAVKAIEDSYISGSTDEFVKPTVIQKDGKPIATIKNKDSVIFFNFRPDRARELTRAFCDEDFKGFDREDRVETTFVCFTNYDITIANKLVAFDKVEIKNTFGEFLAKNNLKQLRLAETEKYAHVTFFFNGGVETPNVGEDRILIPSPKVATYDLQPEMSAVKVCDALIESIKSDKYDVIIVNFANPDMVGHTGIESAVIKAIEVVDSCVGEATKLMKEKNGIVFICADHGNAEQLLDPVTGGPFTAHTTNPVPFILIGEEKGVGLKEGGCLADIVPTLIEIMGMEKPVEMTGESLLIKS